MEEQKETLKKIQEMDAKFESIGISINDNIGKVGDKETYKALRKTGRTLEELAYDSVDQSKIQEDVLGDGDQSFVLADHPRDPGQRLRDLWSEGGNVMETVNELPDDDIIRNCHFGLFENVKTMIDATEPNSYERKYLLEHRISNLRMNALLVCIAGSREVNTWPDFLQTNKVNHLKTADYLLAAGARCDVKDVAGYSAIQHCTTSRASVQSLAIFNLLVSKYNADVTTKNRFGAGPMMEAAMCHRADIIETILSVQFPIEPLFRSIIRIFPEAIKLVSQSNMPHRKRDLQTNDRCKLVFLLTPELNGIIGTISERDYVTGRWPFTYTTNEETNETKTIKIKRHNLEPLVNCANTECSNIGLLTCTLCYTTKYCSKECQKVHWKIHKTECSGCQKKDDSKSSDTSKSTVQSNEPIKIAIIKNNENNATEYLLKTVNFNTLKSAKSDYKYNGNVMKSKGIIDSTKNNILIKIKIQVPEENGPILIYNKERSFATMIAQNHSSFKDIQQFVRKNGTLNGQKLYINCNYSKTKKSGEVKLVASEVLDDSKW